MFTLVLLSITLRIQRTRGAHFGDEFLFRVRGRAEETQVRERCAVEPRRMAHGVHDLMEQGGVIRFRAVKAGRARQMQRIRGRLVERPLVAFEDRGPVRHGAHQLGTPLDGGEAVRGHRDGRYGHAVELRGVEDGEVPEHKTLLLVPGFWVFFGVDLPEDDRDAALALADAAPSRFHLVERGPERGRVAHRRQQPDVDAAIGPLAEEVAWQPCHAVPWSVPGHRALLQEGENPGGDDLVGCRTLEGLHRKNLPWAQWW